MRKKGLSAHLVAVVGLAAALFSGCNREEDIILRKLEALEEGSYEDRDLSKRTIEELKQGIRMLEEEVDRTVSAGEHLGTYYRMVAIRYMDRNMFGLAAEFFEKALRIYPANRFIVQRAAVCTGKLYQAETDPAEKERFLDKARDYYLYALELDSKYVDALYGLSVLYVFEYEMPSEARPYLERIMDKESYDFRAMFLLARVYVSEGRTEQAVSLYDRIIGKSSNDEMVRNARRNRDELLGRGGGG